jgi:hypothetical protein
MKNYSEYYFADGKLFHSIEAVLYYAKSKGLRIEKIETDTDHETKEIFNEVKLKR